MECNATKTGILRLVEFSTFRARVTSAILLLSYLFYELYPYIRGKLHLFRRRRKAG
jgi:hypothetical protein